MAKDFLALAEELGFDLNKPLISSERLQCNSKLSYTARNIGKSNAMYEYAQRNSKGTRLPRKLKKKLRKQGIKTIGHFVFWRRKDYD